MFENILELTHKTEVDSVAYFLDANIWLYAWQGEFLSKDDQKICSEFFYKIIESEDKNPVILMPTLLFSEIFNKYIRSIAFDEFKDLVKEGKITFHKKYSDIDFKKHYRKANNTHYQSKFDEFIDDMNSHKHRLRVYCDEMIISNNQLIIDDFSCLEDFNDMVYHKFCLEIQKDMRVIFVTNDSDFKYEDIEILTPNKQLLRYKKK